MKKFFSNFSLFLVPLIILAFFLPNLTSGKIPIPADSIIALYHPFRDIEIGNFSPGRFPAKNPLITDPVLQTYPWRKEVIESAKSANFPLWNPYSFSGQPLLANLQSAPFSVFNLLFFVFPFKIAWGAQIILPHVLIGFFMYLFLTEIGISKTASIFGAAVLPFSGFFISWMAWGTIVPTAMWLPFILYLLLRLSKKITAAAFAALAFSISQVIFSGHLQTALYVLSASFAFLIYMCVQKKSLYFLILTSTAMFLGILAASAQLLPILEFVKNSARALDTTYYPGRQDWFIPPVHLVQLIAPDFFGNPTTYNYWGTWNYAEFVSFIGIIPLGLALFSQFTKAKGKNFFLALLALGFLLALENPISKIPYTQNLSMLSTLQPSRIIFLLVFCLSTLAAFGFDSFLQKQSRKHLVIAGVLLLTIVVLLTVVYSSPDIFPKITNLDPRYIALRNLALPLVFSAAFAIVVAMRFFNFPKLIIIGAIFIISFVELFRFGYKFTPFAEFSWIFPQTKTTDFLKAQEKPFRIMTTDRRIMHPNISAVYGIESIDGYDPLYLSDYAQFVTVMQSENPQARAGSFNRIVTPQKISSNLINLLNVQYILSFDDLNQKFLNLVNVEGETKIYKNKNSLPRAFFVEEVAKAPTLADEYKIMLEPDFDPAKKAASQVYSFSPKSINSKVIIDSYSDDQITLSVQTDEKKPLVLANLYYPGWQAFLDGEKTSIFKADAIFQLVEVPAGSHRVEFKFAPKSFYNGLYVSGFAALATLALTLYIWRKKFQ